MNILMLQVIRHEVIVIGNSNNKDYMFQGNCKYAGRFCVNCSKE